MEVCQTNRRSIWGMLRPKKIAGGYDIELGKTFGVQKTIWDEKKYDANEYGSKLVSELVPGGGFSFPKSLYTVFDSVYAGTANDKDAIVMDFFSGSATTAHAVMKLNAEDGGNRTLSWCSFLKIYMKQHQDQD